jgi:hypothetical protein
MAIVERPAAELSLSYQDERSRRAGTQFSVASATTKADADAALDVIVPLVTPMTGCALVGRGISYGGREIDPAAIAPAADAYTFLKGVFIFNTAAGKSVTYTIPGFDLTKVDENGKIDTADADVAAFVAAMLLPANGFTDSNGVALASLADAYIQD